MVGLLLLSQRQSQVHGPVFAGENIIDGFCNVMIGLDAAATVFVAVYREVITDQLNGQFQFGIG